MGKTTFKDNVVIITGASSGIGRELACQLADQGAWLSLAARDAGRLQETAETCRKRGGRAISVQTDVSVQDDCHNLIECTIAEYGRIDTLVNNAGISMWTRFDELQDLAVFDQVMRVNYFGAVYCSHYALPYLKKTRGRLVGVSSLAGKNGVPTRAGYSASKHAMVGFFDSLRIELVDTGVSVTLIYPGFVTSEIRERAFGPDGKPLGISPVREAEVMSVEECARLIVNAMARRKREEVMTLRGKLSQWVKLVAPGYVDNTVRKAIAEGK